MTSKDSSASCASFTQLELEGKSYKLSLNFDAMCLWESLTGKGAFSELPRNLDTLKGSKLILFVMLQKHHSVGFAELDSVDVFYKDNNDAMKLKNVKAINDALALELARSWGLNQESDESSKKKKVVSPTT